MLQTIKTRSKEISLYSKSLAMIAFAVICFSIINMFSVVKNKEQKLTNLTDKISKISFDNKVLKLKNKQLQEKIREIKRQNKVELEKIYKKNIFVKNCLIQWSYDNSSKVSKKYLSKLIDFIVENTHNPYLILGIIAEESDFDPTAISSVGALGVGQVMPKVWEKELKEQGIITEKRDLFDPEINVLAMDYILLKYYKQFKDWNKVLNAYVGGDKQYVKAVKRNIGDIILFCEIRKKMEESNDKFARDNKRYPKPEKRNKTREENEKHKHYQTFRKASKNIIFGKAKSPEETGCFCSLLY